MLVNPWGGNSTFMIYIYKLLSKVTKPIASTARFFDSIEIYRPIRRIVDRKSLFHPANRLVLPFNSMLVGFHSVCTLAVDLHRIRS